MKRVSAAFGALLLLAGCGQTQSADNAQALTQNQTEAPPPPNYEQIAREQPGQGREICHNEANSKIRAIEFRLEAQETTGVRETRDQAFAAFYDASGAMAVYVQPYYSSFYHHESNFHGGDSYFTYSPTALAVHNQAVAWCLQPATPRPGGN